MKVSYSKECFGSLLEINGEAKQDIDSVITESFSYIDAFENKYSRFREENWLSELNARKQAHIPQEIKALVSLTLQVSKLTQGYYDVTVLPLLENAGYGISQVALRENIGYKNIELRENEIILHEGISLDFGSFGKGYIVDYLTKKLGAYMQDAVINFGGDMRILGEKKVHLESPREMGELFAYTHLENMSIASSAGNRRKIGDSSHLISLGKRSQGDTLQASYITHKQCTFADIFSTALFVSPFSLSCHILEETQGLEGMLIASDGKIFTSSNFHFSTLK